MDNEWSKLSGGESDELRERWESQGIELPFVNEHCEISRKDLPFYDRHPLYRLSSPALHPPGLKTYVVDGPQCTRGLNGTNQPIYELNNQVPIGLSPSTIGDYIRFFFGFVRGRHGYFYIVESLEDLRLEDSVDAGKQDQVAAFLRPVVPEINDKGYAADCVIFFHDSLFRCPVNVQNDGIMDMGEEDLLMSDINAMPIKRFL